MMKHVFTILTLSLLMTSPLFGQVTINEFSASNLNSFQDNFYSTEDWIELYNTSDAAIDLSGWHLSDKESKPEKWEIPAGTSIPAKGHLLFWCSGRSTSDGTNFHTNFKLAQTEGKDVVLLSDDQGSIIEVHEMEITMVEHSRCRAADGSNDWVVSTMPTPGSSNDNSPQFTRYTAAPSMDLSAGFYDGAQTVSLSNNEPNSNLHYTTDGSNPTTSSPIYSNPISVSSTTVIKAQAFSTDASILPGKMEFNTYFINENFSLAVFSVAADQVIDLANGEGEIIPIGSLEYFNTDKEREATSFGSLNRHGQDSWVLDHRSLDWISRDEMGYSKAVNAPLFSYSKREEYQKFMFRNSGDDNYPAIDDADHEGSTHIRDEFVQTLAQEGELKLDVRAVERVILFLNGQYWGVYGMRERPVDHDYTKEYYDQDKYNLQYLATWNTTEAEYGGQAAFDSWRGLRDFILENDMSDSSNYEQVTDELNVLSLMDYMIVNLNVVAADWLNYNTGWWRGLDPDGDHKKWGYILWDLDAVFDYYINYTGIPNTGASAKPCDIDQISDAMDFFFPSEGLTAASCPSVLNGSAPYPVTDPVFVQIVESDSYCCQNWDFYCQGLYDNLTSGIGNSACESIRNGSSPYLETDRTFNQVITKIPTCCSDSWTQDCQEEYDYIVQLTGGGEQSGNIGSHEKIFLKLQEENQEFRELYYARQADLMNTTFSCQNMNETLDRMLDVIRPEMPRQIDRWGGTMNEWENNVEQLKDFINRRCELLDDGMTDCFDIDGPYEITLQVEPAGIGEIEFNTLDHEVFPWTGRYFGNMDNKIKAKSTDDDYQFSHWESRSGNTISPNEFERKGTIRLVQTDTLVAVFSTTVGIKNVLAGQAFNVFPNPTSGAIKIELDLDEATVVDVELYSIVGQSIASIHELSGAVSAGQHETLVNLKSYGIEAGIYTLKLTTDKGFVSKRIVVL